MDGLGLIKDKTMSRFPTYFISHGGGPWPWVPEWRARFRNLEKSLISIAREQEQTPGAVLVISGHWEEAGFNVLASDHPSMLYDYFGFPDETYKLIYPAPGSSEFAHKTTQLLHAAGCPSQLDDQRGFDHGAFVPLFVMYPRANVPVYQMSLQRGYNPQAHISAGRAIAPLRDDGVLIIGSGLSYHNLSLFGPGAREPSEAFDHWLRKALFEESKARIKSVMEWEKAPFARLCHPQEDHLAPLFVALGAAENEPAHCIYQDEYLFGGVTASSYRFG